jgi:CDP-diacylglycerol--serine O-phosphatidyltransferase
VIYNWCFRSIADEFGVFITFIYAICAASRLARFNIADENLKAFTGLPTPGAAAMVASVINLSPVAHHSTATLIGGTILMPLLGYLMVSKIEFFSVKLLRVNTFGLFARILIGAMIGLLWYNNKVGFLVLSTAYCVSGPFNYWLKRKSRVSVLGSESPQNIPMPDEKSEKPLS